MERMGDQIVAVLTAIVGVAILAVIVSKNSDTADVIGSAFKGFSQALSTAVSPITGNAQLGTGPLSGFTGSSYNSPYYNPFGSYSGSY